MLAEEGRMERLLSCVKNKKSIPASNVWQEGNHVKSSEDCFSCLTFVHHPTVIRCYEGQQRIIVAKLSMVINKLTLNMK